MRWLQAAPITRLIGSTARVLLACLLVLMALPGCQKNCYLIEPCINYCPPKHVISRLPSAFEPLSIGEQGQEWGRELRIGDRFAREMDLYRAITAYKRARFLLPAHQTERALQIDYCIVLAYYLGGKYQEAVESFECSDLVSAGPSFPAFDDLMILLYDAYARDCRSDRSCAVYEFIEKHSPETARDLSLYEAVIDGQVAQTCCLAEIHPNSEKIQPFLDCYCGGAKSVRKAQTLNALLPGAGYAYVGQKQSALTSFLLNTLFTAAAVHFFKDGNIAMGIILTSLEAGWYFGGINGAGLAAKEYNERLWECQGRELLLENRCFPSLMLEFTF